MTTPNAGLYELTGDQRCITTVPMGEKVNVHYVDGSITYNIFYPKDDTSAYAWSPIVPAKRKRWRAEKGRIYYFLGSTGETISTAEYRAYIDNDRHTVGNYFRTEDEAKASPLYKAFQEMKHG